MKTESGDPQAELPRRLQATLGETYTLERELGGGGMARVFLATERALGRRVVMKVLPPETAGFVSAERFRREVQLAARLQHPHIVPLLAAGEVPDVAGANDPLMYYTMPFVEGEALRARLTRETQLPVADALRIAIEVADALIHAHSMGVVHRDIKPENILLSGGHAVVADFGIARALTAAADGTLTSTGLALGTPRYMSPEQAAAERDVDGRSDLFSLAVVLYEMLVGEPPFTGPTMQAVIARLLTEPAPPVRRTRSSVPEAVDSILSRALSKVPADRFQSAAEMRAALEAVLHRVSDNISGEAVPFAPGNTPGGSGYRARAALRRPSRRRATYASALVLLFVIVGGWFLAPMLGLGNRATLQAAGTLGERERILLTDFRGPSNDTLLGTLMAEALRTDLSQSQALRVVSRDVVQSSLQRMTKNTATPLDLALARDVAMREGIKAVLDGDIARAGNGYLLTARLITADSGEILVSFRETAASSDSVIPAIDRLSEQLRAKVGESLRSIRASPPLAKVTSTSIPALRKFVQGMLAFYVEGSFDRGITLLEEAITLDSTFSLAYARLGIMTGSRGEVAHMQEMLRKAFDLRDRLTEAERLEVTGRYFWAGQVRDVRKSLAAFEALLEHEPDHVHALNMLGVIYSVELRDQERAEHYFARRLSVDSSVQAAYFNLAFTQLDRGKLVEARTTIDRLGKRFPSHPGYYTARYFHAFTTGQHDSVAVISRELLKARPGDPGAQSRAAGMLAMVALLRGRVDEALRKFEESYEVDRQQGLATLTVSPAFLRATADIFFFQRNSAAVNRLDAVHASQAFDSLPVVERPYAEFAYWYAEAGNLDRARAMLARMRTNNDTDVETALRSRSTPAYVQTQLALGALALAEKRYDAALSHFRQSDRGECVICALPEIGRAHDNAGNADSAITWFESYLRTPSAMRAQVDPVHLAGTLKRLGELYESRGDRQQAISMYARFIDLWQHADPELQPTVTSVRGRLTRLRDTDRRQ